MSFIKYAYRTVPALLLYFLLSSSLQAASLPDFTALAEKYGPAVVNISTERAIGMGRGTPHFNIPDLPKNNPLYEFFRYFGEDLHGYKGKKQKKRSLGSGFIISDDGYIITNHHVVKGASQITIRLSDRREFQAQLIGSDERSDIALLKVNANGLPTVKIARGVDVKVGEWVLAIGSPFGFDHTVTKGIVSAKGRSLPDETYVPFIQTDVPINPGNSGGPLINLNGEVVGVNSQIYSKSGGFMGLSFAIPMEMAMQVVDQLRNGGHVSRGWLGVYIQDVTRELAESFGLNSPRGALVAKVMPDSPADKAGLQVGDVILDYNGQELRDSPMLPHLVGRSPVGKNAELTVLRQGNKINIAVMIGELPDSKVASASTHKAEPTGTGKLGLAVRGLSSQERRKLDLKRGTGVLVTQVTMGPAANAGIMKNDVILMLDNKPVTSVEGFKKQAASLPEGRSIAVLVQRSNGTLFLALRIPKK